MTEQQQTETAQRCPYTDMTVETCICMEHDPRGEHFRASRGMSTPPGQP